MTTPPSEDFLRPYRAALAAHGAGFAATLWGSRAAQVVRFDVLIDLAGLDGAIVDVGCGTGDLAARLLEREIAFARYHGIDALVPLVDAARARGLPRCAFEVADVVRDPAPIAAAAPDWACLSGTLNTMDDGAARDLVRAAFRAARRGVAFNFLSDRPHARWTEHDLAPARRFDTVGWIEWALSLSSRVSFTQAYLDGHDATIVIERDDGAIP